MTDHTFLGMPWLDVLILAVFAGIIFGWPYLTRAAQQLAAKTLGEGEDNK